MYLALLHFIWFMYSLGLCNHSISPPPPPPPHFTPLLTLYFCFHNCNNNNNNKTKQEKKTKKTKQTNKKKQWERANRRPALSWVPHFYAFLFLACSVCSFCFYVFMFFHALLNYLSTTIFIFSPAITLFCHWFAL